MGPNNSNSNNGGQDDIYTPTEAERLRLKAEHRIGWHPGGGWCRVFPGDHNRTYFGKVAPAQAVRDMHREESRRERGDEAESKLVNLTLRQAANLYLNHIDEQHAAGTMSHEQRASYGCELAHLCVNVGRSTKLGEFTKRSAPEDIFRPLRVVAMSRGVFAAEKHIIQVRTFLDWCSRVRRFITAPFYADAFDPPGDKEKRARKKAVRRERGVAFWQPGEVRELVDAARVVGPHFYAQILLVINGGMGATDISNLEDGDVDWVRRCIHTDRSKTLVPRVVPLWDVTEAAMKASRERRPKPAAPEYASRFFLTPKGKPIVVKGMSDDRTKAVRTDAIRNTFYRLLNPPAAKASKLPAVPHLKRHRGGFYTLRSVFTTLSMGHGQDRNLEAIILGQQFDRPILEFYVRDDQREKLAAIVEHVRKQLWP